MPLKPINTLPILKNDKVLIKKPSIYINIIAKIIIKSITTDRYKGNDR